MQLHSWCTFIKQGAITLSCTVPQHSKACSKFLSWKLLRCLDTVMLSKRVAQCNEGVSGDQVKTEFSNCNSYIHTVFLIFEIVYSGYKICFLVPVLKLDKTQSNWNLFYAHLVQERCKSGHVKMKNPCPDVAGKTEEGLSHKLQCSSEVYLRFKRSTRDQIAWLDQTILVSWKSNLIITYALLALDCPAWFGISSFKGRLAHRGTTFFQGGICSYICHKVWSENTTKRGSDWL